MAWAWRYGCEGKHVTVTKGTKKWVGLCIRIPLRSSRVDLGEGCSVRGVHPPPWDDLQLSNTTGILQKKKHFVVYWCQSKTFEKLNAVMSNAMKIAVWHWSLWYCLINFYVFSAVHIMLLPSQKPSSLYPYSLLCHFLVVHPFPRRILDPPLLLIFCQHQTIQRICKTAKFIPCHILWSLDIPLILLSASPPSYVKHDSNIPLSTPL